MFAAYKKSLRYSMVPLVLLIDLDGTVQGDILPQVEEHKLINKLPVKINRKFLLSLIHI